MATTSSRATASPSWSTRSARPTWPAPRSTGSRASRPVSPSTTRTCRARAAAATPSRWRKASLPKTPPAAAPAARTDAPGLDSGLRAGAANDLSVLDGPRVRGNRGADRRRWIRSVLCGGQVGSGAVERAPVLPRLQFPRRLRLRRVLGDRSPLPVRPRLANRAAPRDDGPRAGSAHDRTDRAGLGRRERGGDRHLPPDRGLPDPRSLGTDRLRGLVGHPPPVRNRLLAASTISAS